MTLKILPIVTITTILTLLGSVVTADESVGIFEMLEEESGVIKSLSKGTFMMGLGGNFVVGSANNYDLLIAYINKESHNELWLKARSMALSANVENLPH